MLGAPAAFAQSTQQTVPQTTTNTPATDTVGPRDLQNFSLGGTVTRRAEPAAPATTAPARPAQTAPATADTSAPAATAPARTRSTDRTESAAADTATRAERGSEPTRQASAEPAPAAASPQSEQSSTASILPSTPSASPASAETPSLAAPAAKFSLWPWLLAAVALGAGGAFLFLRSRRQEAFAGGPGYDAFVAPEPEPAPPPRPAPKPAPAPPVAAPRPLPEPSIPGIVTTRLRPWLEIGINPTRFVVEDQQVALEFELELFNSGNAPARAVLIEAILLNAGNDQEDLLRGFFANPVGEGQRIVSIPPMKRVALKTQVNVGREYVQQYDVGGKKVCVPLLAINALYKWNTGSEGQTSASYLLGRDTQGEKLAPFRLDLGPRLFRGVGARLLPSGLRT
ncbi:MAG: hypothetical protein V4513_04765 [Pseudomonadota bacterium]